VPAAALKGRHKFSREQLQRKYPQGERDSVMDLPHHQRLRDVMGVEIGDGTAGIMKMNIARARADVRSSPDPRKAASEAQPQMACPNYPRSGAIFVRGQSLGS
jgi:hypothetical protein